MRIVHITNHFLPSSGGVEWSVLRTAEAQVRAGHEATVITETPAGDWSDSNLLMSVHRFQVPLAWPFTRLFYWHRMWSLRRLLRSADVLHFHDYTVFIHWFLPLRFLIRGPRYAVTFHGFEHWPVRWRHQVFRSLTARFCHVRFAVGSFVRELYRHPVDAVYLGAPVRQVNEIERSRDMTFVYTGRLAPDTLLLPMVRLLSAAARESGTALRFEAAGEGELRDALSGLAHDHCDIVLHGQIADTLPVLHNARFIVATGFLSILEAFQTGIPVIIPAFSTIKQQYVDSIAGIDDLATVLRSEEEGRPTLRDMLSGTREPALLEKAVRARAFVSDHTWDDISIMLEQWYTISSGRRSEIQDL